MRVQVQVDYQLNLFTNLQFSGSNPYATQSNVSHADKLFEPKDFQGFRGFHFMQTASQKTIKADGTFKYYPDSGYQGYVSRVISGSSTSYIYFNITFTGETPKQLIITFDSICNEYATYLMVISSDLRTKTYNNNKPVFVLDLENDFAGRDIHILNIYMGINRWSKESVPMKVTSITANYVGHYDLQNLIDVRCSENSFDAQLNIKPGIVEQYADVSIYDRDQLVHQFAQKELLKENQKVTVLAIDNENDTTEVLGTYQIDEWQVEATSSIVKVNCTDPSRTFESFDVPSVPVQTRTIDDFLNLLFNYTQGYIFKYADEATQTACENIKIPSSWYLKGNVLEVLKKICEVGQLRVYWFVDLFVVARCY